MTHTDGIKDVETLINRFGGMRPMARKIDVPVSTIQGWKKRDYIPADRVNEVVKAARANSVSLSGLSVPTATNENVKVTENETDDDTTSSQGSASSVASAASPVRPRPNNFETGNNINIKKIRNQAVRRSVITTCCLLLVLGGVGYVMFGQEAKNLNTMVKDQTEMDRKINEVRGNFESFEATVSDGLNNLNQRVSGVAAAVGVERDSEGNIVLNNNMSVSERVTALESRLRVSGEEIDLGQLVNRFDNITKALQGNGDTTAAMKDMEGVINNIQGQISSLDAALEQAKQNNAELAESLKDVTGRDLSAAAMLLAMTQMRESLNRSEPFSEDLDILQELVGEDDPELTAAINKLAPYAKKGVLTPENLSAELRGMTGEIIAAALRGEDVSIKEKFAARLGQILSIEKDGKPVMGIKEQTIIANAQAALDRGDVSSAVQELNKLEGPAAQAAAPITTQALGTLNAQNTITMLMQNMVEKMQDPQKMQNMIQSVPEEIKKQMQGTISGSQESGLIILQ